MGVISAGRVTEGTGAFRSAAGTVAVELSFSILTMASFHPSMLANLGGRTSVETSRFLKLLDHPLAFSPPRSSCVPPAATKDWYLTLAWAAHRCSSWPFWFSNLRVPSALAWPMV